MDFCLSHRVNRFFMLPQVSTNVSDLHELIGGLPRVWVAVPETPDGTINEDKLNGSDKVRKMVLTSGANGEQTPSVTPSSTQLDVQSGCHRAVARPECSSPSTILVWHCY